MTAAELEVEADAWLLLLRDKTFEASQAELAIRQKNKTIEKAEEVKEALEDTKEILEDVHEASTEARDAGTAEAAEEARDLADEAKQTAAEIADELVVSYRLYAEAVSDVEVDVSDTQALWSNLVGWMGSEVGGLRLARNLAKFLVTLFGFWIVGLVLGKLVDKALAMTRITVVLMRSVIVRTVCRATYLVGIIVGLSAMETNVGPILAVVGAAGFFVAFALQNTLSNFASGIMIMIYRPYGVGDVIHVSGITGVAQSMNLVSTTVATLDKQLLVVPNNPIWGNVITNITGSETRRVDLRFGIGYDDDIDVALRVLQQIVDEHALVMDEPKPKIAVNALSEYTV